MKSALNIFSAATSAVALLSMIWIVVPAPFYSVWLLSVAASEWSLWLAALASVGIIGSLLVRAFYPGDNFWIVSLIAGTIAFVVSIYPLLSVIAVAREQNVSLSLSNYFRGVNAHARPETNDFTTYSYARIGAEELLLDVYLPTEKTNNNGASVIVIHGGSWNGGERNDFPQWNRWLAAQGFTVFDVDYRLAPQPNYSAATGDVKCAVQWAKSRAAEFKVDANRIALFGRSAGAHLALLAAYSAGDERLPSTCSENKTDSDKVRAVVSFYAPTDLLWAYDNPANDRVIDGPATLRRFLGGSPHESAGMRERFILASPALQISSAATPPTLLVHGGHDQLVRPENMNRLAVRLTETAVQHKTVDLPYAQHGFDYNFNGWGSQIVKPLMLDFLSENTK